MSAGDSARPVADRETCSDAMLTPASVDVLLLVACPRARDRPQFQHRDRRDLSFVGRVRHYRAILTDPIFAERCQHWRS